MPSTFIPSTDQQEVTPLAVCMKVNAKMTLLLTVSKDIYGLNRYFQVFFNTA